MAPPTNGNEYKSFTDLIALERLNANSYRSIALAFGPAEGTRTYDIWIFSTA
ncbi:hypothetical protein LTR42_009194 [Elasticomyces elasticus]|nr:hypothetical protein LTR42_009194 [Elasticomyces elasticus]